MGADPHQPTLVAKRGMEEHHPLGDGRRAKMLLLDMTIGMNMDLMLSWRLLR